VLELRYSTSDEGSPFEAWFSGLDARAAAKVAVALTRLEQGNPSNVRRVGAGVLECRIDWGPGYRVYFARDGDVLAILLTGGTSGVSNATSQRRMTCGRIISGGGRRGEKGRDMALTRSFKELVQQRVTNDPAFGEALLRESIETMLAGDVDTGKAILRDYIKATVGFEKLGEATGTQPKSLIRMFGPRGNPQARNLFSVIGYLQKQAGVQLHVTQQLS
jgi:putative addiction module killer protein